MKLTVRWDPAALYAFHRLPIHSATLVDRTVLRFAQSGEGYLEWVAPYYRLRAGFFDLILVLDIAARSVTVLRIYRSR